MSHEKIVHRGVKIPVFEHVISPKLLESIRSGKYESNEARILDHIIEDGEVVLEIGGGIGFISTIAALNKNTKSVEVFEANPNLREVIDAVHAVNQVENVKVNTGVLLHNPVTAVVPFYLHRDFWASSLIPGHGRDTIVEVPTYSFNAALERIRPTLIICDIEGGEVDLFFQANLQGVKKVLLEVHQNTVGRENMKRLFDSFSARDFHYDQNHSSGSVILFTHVSMPLKIQPSLKADSQVTKTSGSEKSNINADSSEKRSSRVSTPQAFEADMNLRTAMLNWGCHFFNKKSDHKYHLHLGLHKTATTFAQTALWKNSESMSRDGVHYWELGYTRKHISPHLKSLYRLNDAEGLQQAKEMLQTQFAKPEAISAKKVLVSDENLLGFIYEIINRNGYKGIVRKMRPICEMMDGDVKVFLTIRNYADFIASLYCEMVTTKPYFPFERLKENGFAEKLSWRELYQKLVRVFGRCNVVVCEYQTVVSNFKPFLEMVSGSGIDFQLPNKTIRPSPSAKAIQCIGIESEWFPGQPVKETVKKAIQRFPKSSKYKAFDPWTEEERKALDARYLEDLAWIPCWRPTS